MVTSSANSRSLPRQAQSDAAHLNSDRLEQLRQVDGGGLPSTLGFVARMISFTFVSCSLASRFFSLSSSGPMPLIGDSAPCRT